MCSKVSLTKRVFILCVIIEALVLTGMEIQFLITIKSQSVEGTGIIGFLLAIGVTLLAIDSVLTENKFEFAIFLITSTVVMGYVSWEFYIIPERTDPVPMARFLLGIGFGLVNYGIGYIVYQDFGWRIYRKIGADVKLVSTYKTYQIFVSLLKMGPLLPFSFSLLPLNPTKKKDFLFNVVGVVTVGIFLVDNVRDYELWLGVTSLILTFAWAILGLVGARKENKLMFIFFFAFSVLEPVYIIGRILYIIVVVPSKYPSAIFPPIIAIGLLELLYSPSSLTKLSLDRCRFSGDKNPSDLLRHFHEASVWGRTEGRLL